MQSSAVQIARKKCVTLLVLYLLFFLVIPVIIGWFYAFAVLGAVSDVDSKYQGRLSTGRILLIIGFFTGLFHIIGALVLMSSLDVISGEMASNEENSSTELTV